MKPGQIRPLALCIFRRGSEILVCEYYNPETGRYFYRPMGGTIEYGEPGITAVAREIQEELGLQITNIHYIGTLENIFNYHGETGHEIVLMYEADFVDESVYQQSKVIGRESDGGEITGVWISLDKYQGLVAPENPLYPEGLIELLREAA